MIRSYLSLKVNKLLLGYFAYCCVFFCWPKHTRPTGWGELGGDMSEKPDEKHILE